MKIQVAGLSEGAHRYRFTVGAAELGVDERFAGQVVVEATLDRVGTQMHLRAEVQATGSFVCDRCVAPFSRTLRPSYTMHYVADETETGPFDPAEVQVLFPGNPVIDIADDVRQTLLLSVPLKLLCREDCRGLCPRCAKDLNDGPCGCESRPADSRWEALRRLQSN